MMTSIALLTSSYNGELTKSTRESRKKMLAEVKGVIRQFELPFAFV